jgi:murein L,D-transpeptidase YcbB/YkuD
VPADLLLVNIPEYRLHVIESGKQVFSMDAIVGNVPNKTAIFSAPLKTVIFCPYWNVPAGIIRKELLPKLKSDPSYLEKMNMEVVSNGEVIDPSTINWNDYTTTIPFVIRQKPGKDNSLGLIMFMFPNLFDIYMHDTPGKELFDATDRAFSHGCIRLQEPEKLARYLLEKDKSLNVDDMEEWMEAGEEKHIAIKQYLPVVITYFTAWVDDNGVLNFRKDIYGFDQKMEQEVMAY